MERREVVMRKSNSLANIEADAEVILANAVIATILLKGKLSIRNTAEERKRDNKMKQ